MNDTIPKNSAVFFFCKEENYGVDIILRLVIFVQMELTADNKLKKLIVVGDRLLIKPKKEAEKTDSGLFLPPGVKEKEKIQSGYIVKAGPGLPIPMPVEEEDWKPEESKIKYLPLQAKEGDLAIFLQNGAFEVIYQKEKYFIVPQASILMLEREEDL